MQAMQTHIAQALLAIGAVSFQPERPLTFKSGIVSPVYVDNRRLPYWPEAWHTVIEGLAQGIAEEALRFDVIAGVAAAGIPHSAALSYVLKAPSVFIRKAAKTHGTGRRIEGGEVSGKHLLLVEDMITTGGSSLSGVAALRQAGAVVTDCLCITSYGFAETWQAFDEAGVTLHVLAPFRALIDAAVASGHLGAGAVEVIEAWLRDPHNWRQDG